jgi:hypothetical protein
MIERCVAPSRVVLFDQEVKLRALREFFNIFARFDWAPTAVSVDHVRAGRHMIANAVVL